MRGADLSYYIGEGKTPPHVSDWTAGYAQGATAITLSNTSGLSEGMFLVLDQLDDTADPGSFFVCDTQYTGAPGTCSDQAGGGILARTVRAQHQWVKVVSCSPSCGSAGPSVVTIDRPLHMPNWRAAQLPQAWWGNAGALSSSNGVEDLSIDAQSAGISNGHVVSMVYVTGSWVKHVRMLHAPSPKTFVVLFGSSRNTIRDSYGYGTTDDSGSSQHYGVEDYGANDNLIENNIWQRRTSPFVRDGTTGSVYGYNFSIDDFYNASPAWMQADHYSHTAGNGMVLDEGNSGIGAKGDIVHGTSNLFTYFRNHYVGWEPGKTAETSPVNVYAFNRYYNFIGNVLGMSGYHNDYRQGEGTSTSIYRFGRGANAVPPDSVAAATMLRWGNYDVVTGTVRFEPGEVPSQLAVAPNPVPASTALPASFYLPGKPSWWGSVPWPAIGPDVTGGDIAGVAGHAFMIPAEKCFRTVMTDDTAYPPDSSGTRPKHFTCWYPLP
jgi:hypothetical protein